MKIGGIIGILGGIFAVMLISKTQPSPALPTAPGGNGGGNGNNNNGGNGNNNNPFIHVTHGNPITVHIAPNITINPKTVAYYVQALSAPGTCVQKGKYMFDTNTKMPAINSLISALSLAPNSGNNVNPLKTIRGYLFVYTNNVAGGNYSVLLAPFEVYALTDGYVAPLFVTTLHYSAGNRLPPVKSFPNNVPPDIRGAAVFNSAGQLQYVTGAEGVGSPDGQNVTVYI